MSDLEEKKEEIGYLKFLMGIVTAIIMGLISWFVANVDNNTILIYFDVFGVIIALVFWFLLHQKITKDIKSLKDL
jgi:ABC-type enterobactin transport system permease subunit